MPKRKRKSLTKAERKQLQSARGKAGAEARGIGGGSRRDFVLPAQWSSEVHDYGSFEKEKFRSPGKTLYHNTDKVKDTLRNRGNELCIEESSEESSPAEFSEYEPSPVKKGQRTSTAVMFERQLFVCESTQLASFLESINKTSRCSTDDCNGKSHE